MRIPATPRICISVFLLCAGIILFPVYKHWVVTRTWLAVDMPISLAPGHVRTGDFYVNVSADYHMIIGLDAYKYWNPDCQDYKVLQTHWWLSRNGRVISTWKEYWGSYYRNGTYLGDFDSSSGPYNLDIEILSDATCLQAFHPRLLIYADNQDYVRGGWIYAMALLASWCGLIGVSFGFLGVSSVDAVAQPQVPQAESLAIFDTLHAQREPVRRKLLLMGRASAVPTVGYLYAVTSLVLFLALAPFELVNWNRSFGIPVRLLQPGIIQASTDRQATGLLVYVDRGGNLYLNSKHVTAEELPRALRAEFARRADWSVYVDGDSEAEYADVVRAMDLVRNASGSVIMLTPKMRAEAQRRRN